MSICYYDNVKMFKTLKKLSLEHILWRKFKMKILRLVFSIIIIAALIFGENPQSVHAMPLLVAPSVIHVPGDAATLQAAVSMVTDGNIIELAAGTYTAPAGGWLLNNLGKGFTIRAASGATVTLSGGGTTNILRQINSALSSGRPIIYQDLIFANGYSTANGIAGGVTLSRAEATFINCVFQYNTGNHSWGAGGTVVDVDSIAFFFNTTWTGNSDKNYGGGLAITAHAKAYVHNSRFTNNRTNLPNHLNISAGGGIYVADGTLRVSNTRFENNQAGYVGGAIYSYGTWSDATGSDIIIANCTFENNQAVRDTSVSGSNPTEAGAFHAEDLTTAKIYNSRFITNSAMVGGGVNLYRAEVEIYNSVFQGNRATGTGAAATGFGGAISAISNDTTIDAGVNRRPASLRVDNSLIQGRYASTTTVGQTGGGLYAAGDGNRMYGLNSVSANGTAAQNRATVIVNNVVFYDTDVQETTAGTGLGGGIMLDLAYLTMQNSSILNANALGSSSGVGGGMAVFNQSLVAVTDSTFGHNSSQLDGGAIYSQGSSLFLTNCNLIENSASRYGGIMYTAPDGGRNLPMNGTLQTSIFSNNTGAPLILDVDNTNGPINDLHYNNNQFYDSGGVNATIYYDTLSPPFRSASELNSLVINRNNSTSTDKGFGNTALASAPKVGKILAIPLQILSTNANGDSAPPTLAYLGYGWSGASATLDGNAVAGNAGVSAAGIGTHTLSVGGTNFTASISQAATPAATLTANGTSPVTLTWSVTAGTFLEVAMDHGVTIPSSASGSVQVSPPTDTDYHLYVITKEGGILKSVNSGLPILNVPSAVTVLAGLNYPVNKGYFNIKNDGGSTLQWTATSQTPSLITMDTPSGQTTTQGTIAFTLNVGSLSPGNYVGTINVNAGTGGSAVVTVTVKVVGILYKVHLPIITR